jgi:hypothetical protein
MIKKVLLFLTVFTAIYAGILLNPKPTNTPIFNFDITINPSLLFDDYFNHHQILTISNPSRDQISVDISPLFTTFSGITRQINIQPGDTDYQKASRLFQFVSQLAFKLPWYENTIQITHNPVYFYNVFRSGDCGVVTATLCQLSQLYHLDCRNWHLNNHSVAEIFYQNSWHLFDVTGIGTIVRHGNIMDLNYAINQAKENKLPFFNDKYYPSNNRYLAPQAPIDITQLSAPLVTDFLPNETKILTSYFYLNIYNQQEPIKYQEIMDSYLRSIPLDNYDTKIKIDDYFPIIGAFIIIPKNHPIDNLNFPVLDGTTIQPTFYHIYNHQIIDYSIAINSSRNVPTQRIILNQLNRLPKKSGAILLTLHLFSKKSVNLNFNSLNLLKFPPPIKINY